MAKTLADLSDLVLIELGEMKNSPLPALPSGTGTNGIAISATDNIKRLLNDAKNNLCRTAFLYPATGTQAVTASGAVNSYLIESFTGLNAAQMLGAKNLFWTPASGTKARLTWIGWSYFQDRYPNANTDTAAVPKYWTRRLDTRRRIDLNKIPNTDGTLTLDGYGIPADLSADTDTISWLPDDRYRALVCYAAALLCRKGADDPVLANKFTLFAAEYDQHREQMRAELNPHDAQAFLDPLLPLTPAPLMPTGA